MAILKSPAFYLQNSPGMSVLNRFSLCELIQKPALMDIDKERDADIKAEQEATYTEQEIENRQNRRERYKPQEQP